MLRAFGPLHHGSTGARPRRVSLSAAADHPAVRGRNSMPRFVVERRFAGGLDIPTSTDGSRVCRTVINNNAEEHVTWVTSYVTSDRAKSFDVYDGPSPDAI